MKLHPQLWHGYLDNVTVHSLKEGITTHLPESNDAPHGSKLTFYYQTGGDFLYLLRFLRQTVLTYSDTGVAVLETLRDMLNTVDVYHVIHLFVHNCTGL